jgi:uncharacterized protein (TIRG00374 family)
MNKKNIIKATISVIFLAWSVLSGDIDYTNIYEGIKNLKLVIVFFTLTFLQLLINSLRTEIFMLKTGKDSQFFDIVKLIWASIFLTNIIPFGLVGDAYKTIQLIKIDKLNARDYSFYNAIFSKIFSTLSLVFIAALASIAFNQKNVNLALVSNSLIIIIITLLAISIFFKSKIISFLTSILNKSAEKQKKEFIRKRLLNLREYLQELFLNKKRPFKLIILSLLLQLLNSVSFVCIVYALNVNVDISFVELLAVIPVGIFIMSIPISFSGLGVGHVAFSNLLAMLNIPNGADVFTVYFLLSYIFNGFGVFAFIGLVDFKSGIITFKPRK